MGSLFVCCLLLVGSAWAGPLLHNGGSCGLDCPADSKFQYSEGTTYIYSYEASNSLRTEESSELSSILKATAEITRVSRCEMVLQITDANLRHGSVVESSSKDIDNLKRHILSFSWNDGKIERICPHPEDSANINNVKRGILSALQNSMKSLDHDTIIRETDVLGSCDTDYKVKSHSTTKISIDKKKTMAACSNHLKWRAGLSAIAYESPSSPFQHLPLRKDQEYTCHNVINNGIVEEVFCVEKATYLPISINGYGTKARGETKLRLISSKSAAFSTDGNAKKPESLVYVYEKDIAEKSDDEAMAVIQELCAKSDGLLSEDVGTTVHKLVAIVRGLSTTSVQKVYDSLKSKSSCSSPKVMGIFIDSLKASGSHGAFETLAKLAVNAEIPTAEVLLWLTSLPFVTEPDEGAVGALAPLLKQSFGSSQALLAVPSLAHKYCRRHSDCETSSAVKSIIAALQERLGDCQYTTTEKEDEIISVLKGFGNLGYFRGNEDNILKCVSSESSSIVVKVAALESLRRMPCSEDVSVKLFGFYENPQDDDEVRIAALIALSKCPSPQVIYRLAKTYSNSASKQVEVFTWSYLKNLRTTSDPTKQKAKHAARQVILHEPTSVDVTKFSRHFENSNFLSQLNLGYGIEGNLVHSRESFLPKTGSADLTVDVFGSHLNLLEVGVRVENLEHKLEKIFGPSGLLSKKLVTKSTFTNANGTTSEPFKSRIQGLKDKVGLRAKHPPKGSYYIRILGNEMRYRKIDAETFKLSALNIADMIKNLYTQHRKIDNGNTLTFLDNSIMLPSLTGRAYKLAVNGSATISIEANRKFDANDYLFSLAGKYKPSAAIQIDEKLSIHGENYEPSVKAATTINAGHEFGLKIKLENGPSMNVELNYPREENLILKFRRAFYECDDNGERKLKSPHTETHDLNYCTKYINKFTGMEFCGSFSISHMRNEQGQFAHPLLGPVEGSLVMKKIDADMKGYVFKMQIPDWRADTQKFTLIFDTPNSKIDRKFSTELLIEDKGDGGTHTGLLKFHSPFYTFEADATCLTSPEKLEVRVQAVGGGTRRYGLVLDVEKDIKGARLSEYKPTVTLSLPNRTPVVLTGTIVFSKGRKDLVSFTINSDEVFNHPFSLKGNVGREGSFGRLDSNYHITLDVTLIALTKTSKVHGTYGRTGLDVDLDVSLDCATSDGNTKSIKLKSNLNNVNLQKQLSFVSTTEILSSEYPDFNLRATWDFSAKLHKLLKNIVTIHYGEDLNNEERVIHFFQINKLESDFTNFKTFDLDNQLGLRIPALKVDKSIFLSVFWEIESKPKFHAKAGTKINENKYIKFESNFESQKPMEERPLKFTYDSQVLVLDYEFFRRGEVEETSPGIIQGREVLQTHPGHQITIDFVFNIRSTEQVIFHEYEFTITATSLEAPIQHSMYIKRSKDVLEFGSNTNTGNRSPFIIKFKLNYNGPAEVELNFPLFVGKLKVDNNKPGETMIEMDFQTTGREPQRLVGTTRLINEGNGRTISGDINYATANVALSGKINNNLVYGPHELRADFTPTGNTEPFAITSKYEVHDGQLNAFVKYLRHASERLSLDFIAKFIRRSNHFEIEAGAKVSSPLRTFDGKEIHYHLLLNSSDTHVNFENTHLFKPVASAAYLGKITYNRKRGFPGHIKTQALISANRHVLHESSSQLVYGGGKYSFKIGTTPSPGKRMNFETSLEVAARYAAFQHAIALSLGHQHQFHVNAIADFRNDEHYKLESNIDANSYKVYDFNTTMSIRSVTDFDLKMTLLGNITPTIQIHSKAQNANSVTKYSVSLEKDATEIMSGKGEIKKRKKGFNGDMVFNYKGKDFLNLNINNEVRSQKERSYVFKIKSFYRTYSININSVRDKKAVKTITNLCRNENDNCITITTNYKGDDGKDEYEVIYKRGDIELHFERICEETDNSIRRYFTLGSSEKQFGYDLKYQNQNDAKSLFFGIVLPSREIGFETKLASSSEVTFKIASDIRGAPDRQLVLDFKLDNQIRTSQPSKLKVTMSHPVFEKPIELVIVTNYDSSHAKILEGRTSLDYSTNPEDKILSKFYVEKAEEDTIRANINIFHQDEEHLDFQIKLNGTANQDQKKFIIEWIWQDKDNNQQNAFLNTRYGYKDEKFNFAYHRPRLDFSIDASPTPTEKLHDTVSKTDIEIRYNGIISKAQMSHDYEGHCYNFYTVEKDAERLDRSVEICADVTKPVMFSIKTSSHEEEQLVFDHSLEVIRTPSGSINVRHHWNPEFLGSVVFHLTRLGEELMDAGVGGLPISDSPRYQKMKQSFLAKVANPWRKFMEEEWSKFSKEVQEDALYLKNAFVTYYENLPANPLFAMARRMLKVMKPHFDEFLEDVKERAHEMNERIQARIHQLMIQAKEIERELINRCENTPECYHLKRAVTERDWNEILETIRKAISRLPDNLREYVEKSERIGKVVLKRIHEAVVKHVEPLLEYEIVQKALHNMENIRSEIRERLRVLLKYFYEKIAHEIEDIVVNKKYKELLSAELQKVIDDIHKLDLESLKQSLRKLLEEFLSSLPLPSLRSLFRINALDPERGVLNVDLNVPINFSVLKTIIDRMYISALRITQTSQHINWKRILITFKRLSQLKVIPPYEEKALLVGKEHYITFDQTFFDFDGECAYLLASDLQDGNFSLILTPEYSFEIDKVTGDRKHSLGVFVKDTAVLINLADKKVKAGEEEVDLPYVTRDLSVLQEGDIIIIKDDHGVRVQCHASHRLCTASLSGWYYGKTAGLFGTYDYEPSNDFRRPKGQIPNSVTTFAKSWDISKGCKTKNLAPEVRIDKSSYSYTTCRDYFEKETSPLSACFSEVHPEKYLSLCYRHHIGAEDKNKAFCDVAAAYVTVCEQNFVEMNLPAKCITCHGPDGSLMKLGEKTKFENFERKSSETIFVVESHACNQAVLSDADNLARAIDRELTNEGYRNNLFGVVGYGSTNEPMMYTSNGKLLFDISKVSNTIKRIHLNNNESSSALSAVRMALGYPFGSATSKTVILLACSPCKYDYTSRLYPVIEQILLEHEIVLHVISNREIRLRKTSSKERNIIGADAETVFHSRDVTQRELTGEPELRSQALIPKDACVALAHDVNGSFFTTHSMVNELKAWRSIFARRVLKSAQISPCRWCDCTSTVDHVARTACRPCENKRPRLPFSVCTSCTLNGLFSSLLSYFLHLIS